MTAPAPHTRLSRVALALAVALSALLAVLAAAPRARALSNPMLLGFDDDPAFEWTTGPTRDHYLTLAGQEGGSIVRLEVYWRQVAPPQLEPGFHATDPGDPQYDFSTVDSAVQAANAHHQRVLFLVRDAPIWAERSDVPSRFAYTGAWWPNARMFGEFARALAARYSGHFRAGGATLPAVRFYQAWNEPNLPYYLSPQWGKVKGKLVPLAPGIYRDLLNAFYAGVKGVSRSDKVLSAGTAPYGDAPAKRLQRMHPVTFFESLFCLDSRLRRLKCADPPHLDMIDHHPYSLSPAGSAANPLDVSVVDISRITRVVNAAVRAGTVVPRTRKPVWVTEIAWSDVRPYNRSTQARALSEAFYLLWRQGVATTLWFQLRDSPTETNTFKGSGLYTLSGTAKPVAAAFRFPFCAFPGSGGNSSIWGKAPGRGRVSVQLRSGKRWRTILTVSPGAGGYFLTTRRLGSHEQLRAVQGRSTSLAWSTTGGL